MQSAETLANLQKVLTLLDPASDLEEMLTNVAKQLVEMFGVDHSGVLLYGDNDIEGVVIAEYPPQEAVGLKLPLTNYPLVTQLKAQRQPIAVLDAQNDPIMGVVRPTMRLLGIHSILIIPLIVKDKLIGGLGLDALHGRRTFTADEINLAHTIGKQIAVAIDYTDSLKAIQKSRHQTQILREISQALGETLNLDEVLPLILEQLEKVLPVDGSSIYLLAGDNVQLKARRGGYTPFQNQQIIPLKWLWGAAEIVRTRKPLLVSDTAGHPYWNHYQDSPLKSWLGTPLIANGELVGVLNMDGYAPHRFDESHLPMALAFANQSAIALYNAQLYGQAKKRADLLASVHEIGVRILASFDLEAILQAVISSVLSLLEAGQARIYLYDAAADTFTLAAILNKAGQLRIKVSQPRKEGLTATVALSGELTIIPDIFSHPLYRYESGIHGFRAIASVPLKKRAKVLGVLNVFFAQVHYFPPEEIDALELLATQTAIAIENSELYGIEQARLQDQAKRAQQWRRVQQISSTLNKSLDLHEVLNTACELFVQLIGIDHCGVVLLEDALMGRLVAEYPLRGALNLSFSLDYPGFQRMLQTRQPLVSANVPEDDQFGSARATLTSIGVQSILLMPLVVQDQVIGSIGLDTIKKTHHFSEEEIYITRVVTDQMAIAVTNARAYQAEHTARIQADTLREVAGILGETLDLSEVLTRILAQLERVMTCDSSSIILRENNRFRVVAARPGQVKGLTFTFKDKPHFREIANTRLPLVISDTSQFPGWQHTGPTDIKSWIGAPLLVADQLSGILTVDHSRPGFYKQRHAELITAFADLAAIALENARLYDFEVKQVEQELHIARQIQRGFFPSQLPTVPGWAIAAVCNPARETGGDFYAFVEREDDSLGIVVGDVSGKSIPAAMLMAGAQSVVRSKGSDHRSPAKVIQEANRLLYDDMPDGAFVAVSYALLCPTEHQVWLSSGGQVAPFFVPANGDPIRFLEPPGDRFPLGVLPKVNYEEMSLSLAPGDMLIFYTDGLIEEHDKSGMLFGFERVTKLLEVLRGKPPETVLKILLKATREFSGDMAPHDDITVVILQRNHA